MVHVFLAPLNLHARFILHDCGFELVSRYHHGLGLYRMVSYVCHFPQKESYVNFPIFYACIHYHKVPQLVHLSMNQMLQMDFHLMLVGSFEAP